MAGGVDHVQDPRAEGLVLRVLRVEPPDDPGWVQHGRRLGRRFRAYRSHPDRFFRRLPGHLSHSGLLDDPAAVAADISRLGGGSAEGVAQTPLTGANMREAAGAAIANGR